LFRIPVLLTYFIIIVLTYFFILLHCGFRISGKGKSYSNEDRI
jgi:hypothetical protein